MNPLHILTPLNSSPSDLPLTVIIPATIGNVLWVILYLILIFHARKNRFMEVPILMITGDLMWEGLYGFVFPLDPNLNPIIQWGIKAWFVIDCAIFFFALKYAANEINTTLVLKYIIPISAALLVFWGALIWAIADSGTGETAITTNEDLVREAISAYFLNIGISVIYVYQYLRLYNQRVFLPSVAWLKMLGTGLTTVAVYFNTPFNLLLFVCGILVFIADVTYIVLLRVLPNKVTSAA